MTNSPVALQQQFSAKEWLRYTRQLQLPQIGVEGQCKLSNAHVLVVGAGGLGCPVGLYLAAAGVGHLTILDADVVDLSNLQRQVLYTEADVGASKVHCAKQRLQALNGDIHVDAVPQFLNFDNAATFIAAADLVLDCSDNFATRYLINDICFQLATPWIFASVSQFAGQCALFNPQTACFRCLFPDLPKALGDCNESGVLGVVPGTLGMWQSTEALKYLLGLNSALLNHLLVYDAIELTSKRIALTVDKNCLTCQQKLAPALLQESYLRDCGSKDSSVENIGFDNLKTTYLNAKDFSDLLVVEKVHLLDVRSEVEHSAFNLGGQCVPLDKLENFAAELSLESSKEAEIVVYCQTGKRSNLAVRLLMEQGFNNVRQLHGGIVGYIELDI